MVLTTLPGVITSTVSHLLFQLFVTEIMILETLSNLLKFTLDYVPRSLFTGQGLILGWISFVEMGTNFIGRNNSHFSSTKESWAMLH